MGYERKYLYRDGNGHQPSDILVELYGDSAWRLTVLQEEDIGNMVPWKICNALQNAYQAGREDAKKDIRLALGINEK